MIRILLAPVLAAALAIPASAQTPPAPQRQPGIGPTGTMYDGNNLVRFPLARPPSPNPGNPAAGTPGVTGAQGSRDENGTGAGGGEH